MKNIGKAEVCILPGQLAMNSIGTHIYHLFFNIIIFIDYLFLTAPLAAAAFTLIGNELVDIALSGVG